MKNIFFGGGGGGKRLIASEKLSKVYKMSDRFPPFTSRRKRVMGAEKPLSDEINFPEFKTLAIWPNIDCVICKR